MVAAFSRQLSTARTNGIFRMLYDASCFTLQPGSTKIFTRFESVPLSRLKALATGAKHDSCGRVTFEHHFCSEIYRAFSVFTQRPNALQYQVLISVRVSERFAYSPRNPNAGAASWLTVSRRLVFSGLATTARWRAPIRAFVSVCRSRGWTCVFY